MAFRILKKMRTQDAVYWPPVTDEFGRVVSNDYGVESYDVPAALLVAWYEVGEVFVDSRGNQRVSNAVVWVEEVVKVGGFLWKGKLTDLPMTARIQPDPKAVPFAWRIEKFSEVPDLKGTTFVRRAYL